MRQVTILVTLAMLVVASLATAKTAVLPAYLSYPVLIKFSETASGSAFYYKTNSNAYLITAKHVLYDPKNMTLRYPEAELVSYIRVATEPKKVVYRIFFGELEKQKCIHLHPTHDLAVVKYGDVDKDSQWRIASSTRLFRNVEGDAPMMCVMEENTLRYDDVGISNEIYVLGYPRSIGLKQIPKIDYDMPLLRRGIVAGKSRDLQTIVIDCRATYGNSGGPVCQVEHDGLTKAFKIIGIVSEFIPFIEIWENKTRGYSNVEVSESGYSIVTPIDAMFELIETIEKAEGSRSKGKTP